MRYTSILRASVVLVFVIAMGLIVTLPWAGKAAAAEGKTLKIGVLLGLGNPLGRDTQKLVEAVSEAVNKKGGLTIGGEKYHIQLILYDNKDSAETARAGAERLVFQDGVKFILGDTTADAWLPVTEANKVVAIVTTPSPAAVNARLKYTFQASFLNTGTIVNWGWFCGAFPAKKKLGGLFADGLAGHGDAKQLEVLSKVFGLDMSDHVFYPAGTTDFSALATRIKSGEPQVFTTAGTGPLEQTLALKAMRQAGWEGPYFGYRPLNPGLWGQLAPMDTLEGSYFAIGDIDAAISLGTTPTAVSKEAQDAWIAKYGKWENPNTDLSPHWYLLRAALEASGSVDPEKVAATIAKGLKFDMPFGQAMMISRPDMGSPTRTVDTIFATTMGTVEKGKVKILHRISLEEALGYIKKSKIFGTYPQ